MNEMKRSASPPIRAVMLLCAALAAQQARGVVIDDFSAALGSWPVVQNFVGGGTVQEFVGAPVLGGVRETTIIATSIALPGVDQVQVGVFPVGSVFDYASSVGADGTTSLFYDGGSGLGGVDFSADQFLGIDFSYFDLANDIAMPVTVTLTDTTASTAASGMSLTIAGSQSVQFLFSSFAGVDLSSIDAIEIDFEPGIATDFRLELIETSVPEPASLGLLLLGGVFCSRRGSRR